MVNRVEIQGFLEVKNTSPKAPANTPEIPPVRRGNNNKNYREYIE